MPQSKEEVKQYMKEYLKKNREKIEAKAKIWRENNREKRREYSRNHYNNNLEYYKTYFKKYYSNHQLSIDNYYKQYYKDNREKILLYQKKYNEINLKQEQNDLTKVLPIEQKPKRKRKPRVSPTNPTKNKCKIKTYQIEKQLKEMSEKAAAFKATLFPNADDNLPDIPKTIQSL